MSTKIVCMPSIIGVAEVKALQEKLRKTVAGGVLIQDLHFLGFKLSVETWMQYFYASRLVIYMTTILLVILSELFAVDSAGNPYVPYISVALLFVALSALIAWLFSRFKHKVNALIAVEGNKPLAPEWQTHLTQTLSLIEYHPKLSSDFSIATYQDVIEAKIELVDF